MKEFKQLVTVKMMREEKAERTVHTQRRVLVQAERERDDAQQRLDDYQVYAVEQERRIYQELCTRVVKLRDIEDVHGQVQALRFREADYREELQAAQTRREREEHQLETDKTSHKTALRTRDKFVEMDGIFTRERVEQAEHAEEAEIEETASNRRPATPTQEPA